MQSCSQQPWSTLSLLAPEREEKKSRGDNFCFNFDIFCSFQNLLFRINFLPGRERDVWTREGMSRESLPRNGLPSSRVAEGLPSREGGYNMGGGRWVGGATEGSPSMARLAAEGSPSLARRAPNTPPILQHHQATPEHPHFIPPPVRQTSFVFSYFHISSES